MPEEALPASPRTGPVPLYAAAGSALRWDVFCRVIDNHGDLGVCWRLACDLAARGHPVRLWVDDASALCWMAPRGRSGVAVAPFEAAGHAEPGDVVVEAFGCDPPPAFVARMAAARGAPAGAPLWLNLEYLSAEAWVERSHRLPSPQLSGPGAGLTKWFWFPGFTPATGGLIVESDLDERQRAFDAAGWLAHVGAAPQPGERVVSLFCYANAPLPLLLPELATQPTLLLATAGQATQALQATLGPGLRQGALRAQALPHLTQLDFDHLLWASDLNFVRGEDSFVRAQLAGRPFVWQAYPQADGARAAKVAAYLQCFGAPAVPGLAQVWQAWNGLGEAAGAWSLPPLPNAGLWRGHCERWREGLTHRAREGGDLGTQLIRFARERR